MDYLKISQIAIDCEAKRVTISKLYEMIGKNSHWTDSMKDNVYYEIADVNSDLKKLENKLRKLTN